jgi:A/G-specific adenine glycosylase
MAKTTSPHKISQNNFHETRGKILSWYDKHRRELPWRAKAGETPDPYHVWLSEIMLQQTTVQAVAPYYYKFLDHYPTIHDLASAPQEQVMADWAGLGYYARARNLHKCAQIISNQHSGIFPQTHAELLKLPGIGDYTAAAIATIAFNQQAVVMDGNIERIISRLCTIEDELPKAKPIYKQHLAPLFDTGRPGDMAQALMDIGATICTPKNPKCMLCPLITDCSSCTKGTQETYPRKAPKKARPKKQGYIYWIENDRGEILIHRRPEKGLLGGMIALPTSEWSDKATHAKFITAPKTLGTSIRHVFTHFDLELKLVKAKVTKTPSEHLWLPPTLKGLPTVFNKAYKLFISK